MKTKLLFLSFTFFLSITVFIGCKKEIAGDQGPQGPQGNGGANTAIFNKWKVVSGSLGYITDAQYMLFNNDKSIDILIEDAYKFRKINNTTAFITSTQLNVNGQNYNYSIAGDTLKISNMSDKIVCVKSSNAPSISEWITEVISLDSLTLFSYATDPRGDVACDGQYLWISGRSNSTRIYKIDLTTGIVTDSIPFSGYYSSVAYAQGYLWVSDSDKKIHKIDKTNGNDLLQSPATGSTTIAGIAYDGQYLWCNSSSDKTIYKYNILTNTFDSQDVVPSFKGSCFMGGYLYVCNDDFVYKCTLTPFRAVKTYQLKSSLSYNNSGDGNMGIDYDGTNFWITIQSKYTDKYEIHKVSLN